MRRLFTALLCWLAIATAVKAQKIFPVPVDLTQATARQQLWARSYTGLKPIAIMGVTSGAPSAPTVTVSPSTISTINSSNNAASIPAKGLYPNLNCTGAPATQVQTGNPNNNALQGLAPLNTDSSKTSANLLRCRFTISVPQWEAVFSEQAGAMINAMVDGAFVTAGGTTPACNGLQSGGTRYCKFDFGADTLTYGMASSNIGTAGTGYALGDLVTASGGTCTRQPTWKVGVVSSGVPSKLYQQDPGDCATLPTFPAATTTSGSGTGLTIATGFYFPRHTTFKPREVELLIQGGYFYGVNYTAPTSGEAAITPYLFNPRVPSLYWEGDSQDANTYGTYAGGQVGYLAALRLGLTDNLTIDACGGSGFAQTGNSNCGGFEYSTRVAAIVAAKPDFLYVPFSQNAQAGQTAATAACISEITAVQNGSPGTLIVLGGPAFGFQTWHLTAMQACVAAAPNPTHIRYIDPISEGWAAGGVSGYLTSDSTHWGMYGNLEWRSKLLAEHFVNALLNMISPTGL